MDHPVPQSMSPIAKIEIAIPIPIAISKMTADRDLYRSFTIADRFGDLFTDIGYVNFMKNWGNSSLIKSLKTFLPSFSEIVRKFEGSLAYSSKITTKIYA